MRLESLYKETKTGAIQQYDVLISGDSYTISQGQVNGKKQDYTTVCKPKNIGKANETTAAQQAESEGKSKHAKKVKAGYTTDPSGTVLVRLPMKVQTYAKHIKKVKEFCYESPKLNGVNGTYRWADGALSLMSRGGQNYPLIDQQIDAIKSIMETLETDELNGEIYIHGEALQDITSAVKKYNYLTSKLEFHIFDLPGFAGGYEGRSKLMNTIADTEFVKIVHSVKVNSDPELLDTLHDGYVADGYEGMMIRNPQGKYVHNTRSNDVFKFKKALDAEFKVCGYNLDKHGHPVFICIAEEGVSMEDDKLFKVKLKGKAEERLEMAANADAYLDKWLKVEYEMLSNDNIPLKPVGIMFREVGADGEALE